MLMDILNSIIVSNIKSNGCYYNDSKNYNYLILTLVDIKNQSQLSITFNTGIFSYTLGYDNTA